MRRYASSVNPDVEPTDRKECKDCLIEFRLSNLSRFLLFDLDIQSAIAAVNNTKAMPADPNTATAIISFLQDSGSIFTLGSITKNIFFNIYFLRIITNNNII